LDSFDDRYLGSKSSAPTVDNDGNALVSGALYFDSTSNAMKVYDGSQWLDAYASLSGALIANQNLSDLNNAATARTNLGLGTAATTASSDYATAAQGTTADNALAASAVSTFGGTLIDDADAAAARTTLGLGTAATTAASDYATAAQADQTVVLTGSGGTTVSGTYPNFTVSSSVGTTGIVDNSNATAITLNSDESATFTGAVNISGSGSGTEQFRVGNSGGGTDFGITVTENSGVVLNAAEGSTARIMSFATGGTEAFRLTAAQDMYFGQTSGSAADVGIILQAAGNIFSTVNGGTSAYFRRNTSDGEIIRLSKDGTTVGSIGVDSTRLTIGSASASGLRFDGANVMPMSSGSLSNGTVDIGYSANRFRDLYLSGIADASNFKISGAQGTDGQVLTSTGSGVAWEDASSGGGTAGIVSSANATAMTINSDEEIGIGVTNQGDYNANARNLVIGGSGSNGMTFIMPTGTDKARIDFRGASLSSQYGNLYPYIECTSQFASNPYDQMIFAVSGSEVMRFGKGGGSVGEYMLFGKTSYSTGTDGVQTSKGYEWVWTCPYGAYPISVNDGSGYKFEVKGTGQIRSVYTSIASISDERVKENVVDLETGLSQIMALKPRRFDFKDGEGSGDKNVAGFVAQEVESVLPDLIDFSRHDTIADLKALKMGDMIPTMVKAMQEQQALIESLTNRLAALEQ